MKRAFAALASAAVLVAVLPTTVAAVAPAKYTDHIVEAFCETPFDGGSISTGISTSELGGDAAYADVWLDPAIPFEEPPSMTGTTSTAGSTESPAEVVLTATIPVSDPDGAELGDATITITLAPVGDPEIITPDLEKSNRTIRTHGTRQNLEGTASVSLPGGPDLDVTGCLGGVVDVHVFETNPHAFVSSGKGVIMDCFWQESDDVSASVFAINDDFGLFFDAHLTKPGLDIGGGGTGSFSATSLTASFELFDFETGDAHSATATATLTPIGGPVTSDFIFQGGRTKTTEQALAAHGSLDFDTDDSFVMDAEHCRANTFDRHTQSNTTSGPKPGAAPVNDTPEGAVRLTNRSKPNLLTGSTALDPEIPNLTCPSGEFDAMGHTVWYTVIGTGGPVKIDTSGSDFDTVAAAYVADEEGFTEIACIDDVDFVPIGGSFQAILTFDTEAGVEYHIQIGGYKDFFDEDAESGRLRITVR